MAAVFCASFSRSAIRRRKRDILTRSSDLSAGNSATAKTSFPPDRIYSKTSDFVSRPPRPEAGIWEGSRPCSITSFLTAGGIGAALADNEAGETFNTGVDCANGTSTFTGASAEFAGTRSGFLDSFGSLAIGLAVSALPFGSMLPSKAPTSTLSPSETAREVRTPAEGAGTSTVTLSVSNSTRGSSASTFSPAAFNQRAIVASVTDSPSAGTIISTAMTCPC